MNFQQLFPELPVQIGFGVVAGLIVGYTCKKVTKYVAIILGVLFIALQLLAYYKFVAVNWENVATATESALKATAASSPFWWKILVHNFPYAGSFAIGFAIGFKKG